MRSDVLVEFSSPDGLLQAVELLRKARYRRLETYTPYPLAEVPGSLRLPQSWLPKLVFAGGLAGALLGYAIQWYADVYAYPLNVGGRPLHSVPAFIPATFEAMVLGAALTAFIGLLLLIRLPALWHPAFEVDGFERASVDRYWIEIRGVDSVRGLDQIRRVLAPLHPIRVMPVGGSQ